LPPPPMLPAARARCAASTEPLVPVENSVQGFDAYAQLEILPARLLQVRNSTLDRLRVADAALPPGFSLVVLDGWRTIAEQKALVSYYEKLGPTHGYVASVRDDAMRSPHTTGGAVDLTLMFQGKPLALGTDFDSFDPQAHYDAFEATDGVVRRLRRTLGWAMLEAGFVPYPLEWWHWSYGEDVWACAHKRPALFDIIEAK
jgi:D-alanyl-D-alanine dipeptidase